VAFLYAGFPGLTAWAKASRARLRQRYGRGKPSALVHGLNARPKSELPPLYKPSELSTFNFQSNVELNVER
jgi:hypothetical protein